MIEKRKALTANQNTEEDLPDLLQLPEPLPGPELPDLTRLYKRRCRDENIIKKCKIMLVAGMPPGRVALILRLPLEKVLELHSEGWNSRCRRFANPNNGRLVMTMWDEGATLAEICTALTLPLFTVVASLRQNGITDAAMAPRMPPYDDPLCVAYRQVIARKATMKQRPIQINPVRRVRKSQQTTTASQTATA
ncbi:TPA: hypothetical protein MJB77_16835 [Klebsiella pneumoniae]|uniref:hypothetical protein n=1 Tax=Klebsiella variicola TaxID=244366 RepID=UPI0024A6F4E5|nr:hypothetical protein [Klebsiella variicola]HBZ0628906.1 hypothetical protein [Klebsiella pneumoniae]WHE63569.1 hypothetical protein QLG20_04040 [Klebsiella variicola]HBW0854204.1 hypothetical protein [Klebsiella variicola]HBW0859311.1 hypothetical protein [Klebsiella variicola]HBW0865206.1 hypothetical protein [Klebsiella variicola]